MKKVTGIILSSALVLSDLAVGFTPVYANYQTNAQQNEAASSSIDVGNSVNLAKGKEIEVSGVEIAGDARFLGENAVDGNLSTKWAGPDTMRDPQSSEEQWLKVDLGEVTEISEIVLRFGDTVPRYEVQISTDGNEWVTVFTEENGANGGTSEQQCSFEKQPARYVRFLQHERLSNSNGVRYSAGINELEVYENIDIEDIEVADFNGKVTKGKSKKLTTEIIPNAASHKKVKFESLSPEIISVDENGVITGLEEGTGAISVSSVEDPNVVKMITVEVTPPVETTDIVFEESEKTLIPNDKRYLEYRVLPDDATETDFEVVWESSDPEIVSVNQDGLIEAHQRGTATIIVTSKENAEVSASMDVNVTDPSYAADYEEMQNRWISRVVGEDLNLEDEDVSSYVEKIDKEGQELWSALHKEENRDTLWDRVPSDTVSADYTTQFTKLQKLTRAFAVEGTSLYQNKELCQDIIDAIDFMVNDKQYNGSYSTGNWWDWDIGCPHQLADILMIMSDYTDDEIIKTAANSIKGYIEFPERTGANLTDTAIGVLGSAIILKEDYRIEKVKEMVPSTVGYVTSGDGIYKDGSVIQHTAHAYNGSYGNELVKGIGKIQNVIADTKFEITDERISNIYDVIIDGYLPLMHKGQMMSMVNGRSVSRGPGSNNPFTTEFATGSETIANILLLVDSAPADKKPVIQSAIKSWIVDSEGEYDFYANARDFSALLGAKRIMEDPSIEPASYSGMKVYGSMDRAVQVNDDYTVGLSMYSSRIYNYESINNENIKGWHQNDGTLYVYNDDLEQYGEGYWPTVDPYRLPGTTTDTRELSPAAAQGKKSLQSFVGGATDGENGTMAMYYNSTNLGLGMDLKARKSWFLLDGKIVCLGSDIDGTTDASIETTVENRMMTDPDNKIFINGEEFTKDKESYTLADGSYMYFAGTGEGNDLGYYFIQGGDVDVAKETRVGKYEDINPMFPNDKVYEKTYFKAGINHGKTVTDGTYEYIIMPGASSQDVENYATAPSIEVIRNDADVQAIADTEHNVYAMNVWTESPTSVNGISLNTSASVYMTEEDGIITISISDPKQKDVQLNVALDEGYDFVLSKDDTVRVNEDGSFTIDTTGSAGATHTIKVARVDKSELQDLVDEADRLDEQQYTEDSWALFARALHDAKAVLNTETSLQAEVDQAVSNLTAAMQNLVEKETVNKDELRALYDKVKDIQQEEYTEDSWNDFISALDHAKTILESATAVQADVDAAYERLNAAFNSLEKETPIIEPDPDQPSDDSKDPVDTGVIPGAAAYGMAAAMSGLGLLTISKKRRAKHKAKD